MLLSLLLACASPDIGGPMHGSPARRTLSPSGALEAMVDESGALRLRPVGQEDLAIPVDVGVSPDLSFSLDETRLIYARRTEHNETDLWQVAISDGVPGEPARLTDWLGTEDRPALSPDNTRVAFVSGRTGVAAIWLLDLSSGDARQLTNIGLEDSPRAPGSPPRGFLPPPDTATFTWTGEGLRWVAQQTGWSVDPS